MDVIYVSESSGVDDGGFHQDVFTCNYDCLPGEACEVFLLHDDFGHDCQMLIKMCKLIVG